MSPPLTYVTDKNQNNCVLYSQNTIQNDATITNNDNIQSCETAKKNYIIPIISTPNHHTQRISTTSSSILNLNMPTILPPVGKKYLSFLKEDKTDQTGRCIKKSIITKFIDYVLSIDTFEQQCVVLKGMFQSLLLKDNVRTIGIDQSLINNAIHEHKFLENIKKLYKQAGKCDDHQQLKDILEATMVSNPEGFTDKSTISPIKSTPMKKPSALKSLCLFTKKRM